MKCEDCKYSDNAERICYYTGENLCVDNEQQTEDAISREDALMALTGEWTESTDEIIHRFIKRIKALPSVTPKQNGWIPVSERLPEECHAVLIWCPENKCIYCAYYQLSQWWIFGAFNTRPPYDVIAWMPLPEPYKAKSEVKE